MMKRVLGTIRVMRLGTIRVLKSVGTIRVLKRVLGTIRVLKSIRESQGIRDNRESGY